MVSQYAPEGRFRESRTNSDCRDAYLWHSRTKTGTEEEVVEFLYGLVRCTQPRIVIETGAYHGNTSRTIGRALQQNGNGKLFALEISERLAAGAARRCRGLPVEVVCTDALQWSPPRREIDLVFFDSDFPSRRAEFGHFHAYMSHWCVCCWHDTGVQHPVREQIEELAILGYVQPVYLPTPRGLALSRVLK